MRQGKSILENILTIFLNQPLGAVDYLALSQLFHTIIIRDTPQLTLRQKTQARRFITLIDTFYDNKVPKKMNQNSFNY